jgi:hypothetical protein
MPYIGKAPVSGGFHKLDNLTASATATYALTLGGAAYYPETANQLLVSLNGVIQAPQDSFTVSGSNIIFDSALTVSDSIDFVVALGDVLGVGTPTDGTITTAKIGNGAVTDAKIDTMAASKLTGALPAIDGSALTGITDTNELIMEFPAASAIGGSFTHYYNGATNSTDGSMLNKRVPCDLTVTKMFLYVNGALSSGSASVSLMKNVTTAANTISVTTGQSAWDSSPNVSFTAGDRIGIRVVGSGTSAAWYNTTLLCTRD